MKYKEHLRRGGFIFFGYIVLYAMLVLYGLFFVWDAPFSSAIWTPVGRFWAAELLSMATSLFIYLVSKDAVAAVAVFLSSSLAFLWNVFRISSY